MKKQTTKKLALAISMALSLSFAGLAYANPVQTADTSVAVQVEVKQEMPKGVVNWQKGSETDVQALGTGFGPEGMPAGRARAMARRAAVVDAQRNLLETIQGVQLDSDTLMKDLVIASDEVRTKVSGLIKGARIISEKANEDGSYEVVMAVPMYGVSGSIAAAVVPELNKEVAPQAFPAVEAPVIPQEEVKAVQSITYTGVVVDATGLGLEPTFSPAIFDENGRAIYGMRNIDKDFAISQGMVEYSGDLQQATVNTRAGANPLVVKALAVKGGANSVNPVNVVISVEDGDKILLANEVSGMLSKCAVVFVK